MNRNRNVTQFHAPNFRSTGGLSLLEELGADYELRVLDMQAGDLRESGYLAINPMGKAPAILHEGALITEQVAGARRGSNSPADFVEQGSTRTACVSFRFRPHE